MNSTFKGKYDLIIIGGGVSGTHAAYAAGKMGIKVLLIEQFGFLGGSLTAMGVGPMMTFHNRAGKQLIFGSPQEMIDRLINIGASPGHIIDGTGYCSTVTPFDAEGLKLVLDDMLGEAGVDVLFHSRLIDVKVSNGSINSIIIHNKGGVQEYEGEIFIDASGDSELVKNCKVPFSIGRNEDGKSQPLTMNVKIGNVNSSQFREYIKNNWDQFDDKIRRKEKSDILEKISRISMWGLYDLWEKAKKNGEVTIPRDNVLFFETNTEGEYIFNTSRILGVDIFDGISLSKAEVLGRKQAREIYKFLLKYVPGFENASLLSTAPHVGIRESRHPIAKYVISSHDLTSEYHFENPIAVGGYPIDIHSPDGESTHSVHLKEDGMYFVPVDSILTNEIDNLILSGRSIGADHYASAALRVTPIAMSIGQSAGVLASLSVISKCLPSEVEYKYLREELLTQKVYLGE